MAQLLHSPLRRCAWIHSRLAHCAAAALLVVSGGAGAVTLGAPVLESGLGESLRIVLPVVPTGRDRLAVECVKLRPGGELNDISEGVRAAVVTTGERQALVLTTVRPVNELVISVGVSLECGAFFLRRYTFLLDLPPVERRGMATPSASQTLQAAAVSPDAPATTAAPAAAPAPSDGARTSPTAAGQGARAAPANSKSPQKSTSGKNNAASNSRAPAGQSRAGPIRPEDEPGVLSRTARGVQAARAARPPLAPLASPVRSMLKIELGGIDEFLASQPRLLLEQSTGMRLATDISAPDRQSTAAIAADRGFKQAHARYLAAMRDAPDPVATENDALGKRLDAFSKDLASLKLDLQATRARADALEASRVPWWWLLIAAALAALTAGAGATWWLRRRESQPSGPLIHVDSPFLGRTEASSGRAALDPESNANANASAVADADAVAPPTHNDAPRDTSDDPVSFNLPHFDKIATPSPAGAQAIAAASVAFASATATCAADAPVAPLKLDKNSLTQQIATMSDLSDEAWASYRHPSDISGAAVPVGAATTTTAPTASDVVPANDKDVAIEFVPVSALATAAPATAVLGSSAAPAPSDPVAAPLLDNLHIDFSLDLDPKPAAIAAAVAPQAPSVAPVREAGMISTTDIIDMLEPPALDAGQRAAPLTLAPAAAAAGQDDQAFSLETLDLPATLTATAPGGVTTRPAFESAAPDALESERMREVMAAASIVMEAVHALMQEGHPGDALRALGTYIESAPPQAPPGPWVMLAHALHEVGMQREYGEAQDLFKERFGGVLPGWNAAYELKRQPMGLARIPGVEIMLAAGRGKPAMVGRLAGLVYRVALPPEVLFDLLLHRELLQQAVPAGAAGASSAASDGIDISL